MIQRMVAGHLHLESIPTSTSTTPSTTTVDDSTTTKTSTRETRRPYRMSSTYRRHNITILTTSTTQRSTTSKREVDDINNILDGDDINDDAAFLDSADIGNWDNDILRLSAGGGKEATLKKKKKEPVKTLSEQVKEGKYGLIEKELFSQVPSRPGIISYNRNKEVPYDHEGNFGGLHKEDIWLAEDHLLVIKGGDLNENDNREPWPPLDDYVAPERQIKIPPNPKVPPPFPVQLEDNGPIQFLGNHQFANILPLDRNATSRENYPTSQGLGDDQKNFIAGSGVIQNIANTKTNSYIYPPPYPPWVENNKTLPLAFGPLLHVNRSLEDTNFEPDDEDMSMFYPPPYSFIYKNNYSNPVPPGPLVPGIVIPPPPNAFAKLKPKVKSSTTTSTPPTIIEVVTYTPKTIIITPIAATPPSTTSTSSQPPLSTTTATTTAMPIQIQKQIVYAVPQLQYKPTTTKPDTSSGTLKSNPIYYEYFDSKKEQRPSKTTPGRRPIQNFNHIIQHPQVSPPPKKFIYEDYLYITPKPEVRPNGVPSATYLPITNKGNSKTKQLQSFEHEINVIRQALNFYKNQQLRDNNIPRNPKTKSSIFEYTLDPPSPLQYDVEPFKPMVTYSPPVNDANGFRAISIEPTTAPPTQQRVGAKYLQAMARDTYDDSPHQWVVDKSQKMRVAPAVLPQRTFGYQYDQPPLRQNNRFYEEPFSRPVNNPIRSIVNHYRPNLQWSLENDTYINYLPNFRPPVNSNSEFVNHRNPYNDRIVSLPNRLASQQPSQQQQQPIPLHRDTLVNYRYPLPPINPDSEYIPLHLHSSNSNTNSQYQPPPYNRPSGGGVVYNRQPQQQFVGEAQSNVYYIQNSNKYNNRN